LRDDAVKPDAGQQEGESAEEAREHGDKALLRHCRVDELIEGPEGERNSRLGPPECGRDMTLHRGSHSLAASRVDGQDNGSRKAVGASCARATYIVAIMPSRGDV
jgi:hypothetical protein